MSIRSKLLSASVVAMVAMVGQPALAMVNVTTSLTDNLPPSAVLLSFTGDYTLSGTGDETPAAPIVIGGTTVTFAPGSFLAEGTTPSVSAAPITGETAGPNPTAIADSGAYLSAESGAPITLSFSKPQDFFGLLWGSIDTYNTLTFFDKGVAVETLTGSDITANPDGFEGFGGSSFVGVSGLTFDTVVASSTSPAFEFDFVSSSAVPEPAAWMMMFVGLGALGFMMRGSRRMGALGAV